MGRLMKLPAIPLGAIKHALSGWLWPSDETADGTASQTTKPENTRQAAGYRHSRIYAGWANMASVILWCLFALAPVSCRAENLRLLVVLSDNTPAYKSFADTLSQSLPASVQATVLEQPAEMKARPQADLIVSLGMKAALSAATQTSVPVLMTMIPRTGYEELLAQTPWGNRAPSISAIYMDQPWERQLDFIRAVLPNNIRIGLLYSANTHIDLAYLRRRASERGAKLIDRQVLSAENLFSALNGLLENSDILLALPDNMIYNSTNIRNILLSSYRSGIPFIGMSQTYVTAGALGAIFASQKQSSVQVAEAILFFARTRKLPEPNYVHDFTVSLNHEVARSLGIELLPSDIVYSRMKDKNRSAP